MKELLNKVLTLMAVWMLTASFSATPVEACYTTYGTYGGNEVCDNGSISIDKVVWQTKDNNGNTVEAWKDNIDSSDYKFTPGEEVKFELRVKNTGDIELDDVTVRDILPEYMEWKWGGDWYSSTRTVEWKVNDLEPGEVVKKEFMARFVGESDLDEGVTCVTNKGEAYIKDGDSDNDTAMVCVRKGVSEEKKVLGVSTLPETGPELEIAFAGLSLLIGIGGLRVLKMRNEL